jgi:hypothetical protein
MLIGANEGRSQLHKEALMRSTCLLLLGCVSLLFVSAAPPVDDKAKAEVNWAKKVATDLFEECHDAPYKVGSSTATGLLSPELARAMSVAAAADRSTTLDELGSRYYHDLRFLSDEMAPNGLEVIFTCTLKMDKHYPGPEEGDAVVTFRVAKESAQGQWCVRFVHIKKPETKPN